MTVLPPVAAFGPDRIRWALGREFGWQAADALVEATGPAVFFGLLLATGPATWWVNRHLRRRYPLTCPDCLKEYQSFGTVLVSRRCDHCHGLAIADPPVTG